MGNTKIPSAPNAFSFPIISQKRFSSSTVCTEFLFYRYWNYDLSKPFQEQFEHNQRQLLAFLQEQLAQNGGSI